MGAAAARRSGAGCSSFGAVAAQAAARKCGARPADHRAPPRALPLGGRGPGERDPAPARRAATAGEDSIVLNPPSFRRAQARALQLDRRMQLRLGEGAARLPRGPGEPGERFSRSRTCTTRACRTGASPTRSCMRAAVFADSVRRARGRARRWPATSTSSASARRRSSCWRARNGASRDRSPGSTRCSYAAPQAGHVQRWPDERRRFEGRLLSDHAPVEVTIE